MAAIILPSRRVAQPQGLGTANTASPLARDLRFLWSHGSDRDVVKNIPYSIVGTAPADASTPKGLAKVGASSGNLNFGLRTDLGTPGTNQLSVMAVAYIDNSTTAVGAFMGRVNGNFCFTLSVNGGAQQFTFGINQGSTVAVPASSVAGGLLPTNKRPVVIVGTYNGATADLYVETFGDSAFKGSNSEPRTGNFPSNPSDPFSLLSRGGTGERLSGASLLAAGVWGRTLQRNEIDAILENPWQLYRPLQRSIWVPAAGGSAIDLVSADASHAHAAENVVLSTSTSLAVNSATHAHSAEGVVLTTSTALTAANASHAHTADNLTLGTTAAVNLAVDDASNAHVADSPVLMVASVLAVADAAHAHTAESVGLTTVEALTVASAGHAHSAENVALSIGGIGLAVSDATHAQTADALALSADSFLITANANHGQTADLLTLSTATFFAVDGAVHAQTADNLSLDGAPTLQAAAAQHLQTAETVALTMESWLEAASAAHAHTAQNITLSAEVEAEPLTNAEMRELLESVRVLRIQLEAVNGYTSLIPALL